MTSPNSTVIRNVRLSSAERNSETLAWDIACLDGRVQSVTSSGSCVHDDHQATLIDADGGVLIPSLCHSHIHLDKCFILGQCDPLITGSLSEALQVTNKAKAEFTKDLSNLYVRATRLIRESVESGVTAMRAFVEVDTTVEFACLDMGLQLANEWAEVCHIQIVAFAQEALHEFAASTEPGPNYNLLCNAVSRPGVSVVGSAPWVEPNRTHALKNVELILSLAEKHNLHADFHLDYNLDPDTSPMVWNVLQRMRQRPWCRSGGKRVTIGHATRLGLFSHEEWAELKHAMDMLPLEIVGLPQSDIYMMGRTDPSGKVSVPLAGRTLNAPQVYRDHGVRVALSVNNVENAFTPQGSLDPLTLASLGVALFQVGTELDWRVLLRSVSTTSKEAIGIMNEKTHGGSAEQGDGLVPLIGDPADFVIVHGARRWQSVVLSPGFERTTIYKGNVVARRWAQRWNANTGGKITN
ncbi:Metallo-dependent hydrolase [Rhizopogon vinicolor AM-OR11-026]|uniref:Metallo-dependent hydrolase n=1 Tax=Rhizopogon vinicolor AM-OR11-026 TaxID=1314800 RepID=A0A1B7NAD9_9AGAM|nr:Metallo-dependent hydrolase [Rhizopogon vinicolor AM-OR11-026]